MRSFYTLHVLDLEVNYRLLNTNEILIRLSRVLSGQVSSIKLEASVDKISHVFFFNLKLNTLDVPTSI